MIQTVPVTRHSVFAFLLLSGVILVAHWKLTTLQGFIITDDIFTSDIMNDSFPCRFYMSEALKSGDFPSWIPHVYGGFPLLARGEGGICYPINIFLFGTLPPYVALNVVILLTLITAAFSMYLYVRELGTSFVGGIIAGVAFGLSGYMISHLKHLSNVNAACWLPLGLYFIQRAFKRNEPNWFLALAPVFGLQHLSGHTQIAYYSGLLYVSYFIFKLIEHSKDNSIRSQQTVKSSPLARWKGWISHLLKGGFASRFVTAMVIGSGLGALQLLPIYELVSYSQRAGGVTFDYVSTYSYDVKNLGMFVVPYINGDIGDGTYTGQGIFWEDYGYVGITVFALAVYGSLRLWKESYVKFFVVSAIVSLLLVLGPNTPFYEIIFYSVPGMRYFRFPTRFLLVTDLSIIVLASLGFRQFESHSAFGNTSSRKRTQGKSIIFGLVSILVVVADLCYFQLRQNPIVDSHEWLSTPRSAISLQADSSLFRIYVIGGDEAHKIAFARARGWQGDLRAYINQREFLQPSSNVLYGFSTPNGYANLVPNYLVDVWGDQNRKGLIHNTASVRQNVFHATPAFQRLMDMYNVKYLLSLWIIKGGSSLRLIAHYGEAFLYENASYLPRVYLVGKNRTARTVDDAMRLMVSEQFDPQREVILYVPVNLEGSDTLRGSVRMGTYAKNSVTLHVSSDSEAFLVLADTYYPGWIAEIDGKATTIYQANVTQRAILVPKGEHDVNFNFESQTLKIGAWVSGAALLVFAGHLVAMRMKRRRTVAG